MLVLAASLGSKWNWIKPVALIQLQKGQHLTGFCSELLSLGCEFESFSVVLFDRNLSPNFQTTMFRSIGVSRGTAEVQCPDG